MTARARLLAAFLGLVAATSVGAERAGAGAADADADVVRSAPSTAQRSARVTREYWTQQRMRAAKPAKLVLGADGQLSRQSAPVARQPREALPRAPATDLSADNTGFPNRIHGKVFFTFTDGSSPGDYVCSATIVSSNSRALAWSAGHCVNGSDVGAGFATNWMFVPGYRDGEQPFGSWPATRLLTTSGWNSEQNLRVDIGAAVLARDAEGRGIEDVLGARGIAFDRPRTGNVTALGYPAEPNPGALRLEFDGERLFSCASALGSDTGPPPGNGPVPLAIDCDMAGGSSGGGWINGRGDLVGLVSYGYQGDFNHIYGPFHGAIAEELYTSASGPPLRCAGRQVTNLGGAGNDDFGGGVGAEAFKVVGGDDRVAGDDGNDFACGGGGNDRLAGAAGNDRLRGGGGNDLILGGPGRDVCDGGSGRDRARGCEKKLRIP